MMDVIIRLNIFWLVIATNQNFMSSAQYYQHAGMSISYIYNDTCYILYIYFSCKFFLNINIFNINTYIDILKKFSWFIKQTLVGTFIRKKSKWLISRTLVGFHVSSTAENSNKFVTDILHPIEMYLYNCYCFVCH